MITAKATCTQKVETGEGDARQAVVTFQADYADDRNKEWAKYTPHLQLAMTLNGPAADHFEQGEPYTLQFVKSTD